MHKRFYQRVVSALLISGGVALALFGVRDLVDSRAGQDVARREFESARPSPFGKYSAPTRIARGEEVAKLTIPRLNAALYVLEGDGDRELRMGPGHLRGSALPGQAGNCVIAGHRDTHFRILKDIRKGDVIVLQTHAGSYRYRVSDTRVVGSTNIQPLQPTTDAQLNLVTCYPFYYVGPAPKRFIVQAHLVPSQALTANAGALIP